MPSQHKREKDSGIFQCGENSKAARCTKVLPSLQPFSLFSRSHRLLSRPELRTRQEVYQLNALQLNSYPSWWSRVRFSIPISGMVPLLCRINGLKMCSKSLSPWLLLSGSCLGKASSLSSSSFFRLRLFLRIDFAFFKLLSSVRYELSSKP